VWRGECCPRAKIRPPYFVRGQQKTGFSQSAMWRFFTSAEIDDKQTGTTGHVSWNPRA